MEKRPYRPGLYQLRGRPSEGFPRLPQHGGDAQEYQATIEVGFCDASKCTHERLSFCCGRATATTADSCRRDAGGRRCDRPPGGGRHCAGQRRPGGSGGGLHGHRRRPVVHPQADQDRRAARGDPVDRRATRAATPGAGPDPNQIPDRLTSYGLRTVDGSCNNLVPRPRELRRGRPAVPAATAPDLPRRRADHPGLPGRPPGRPATSQKKGNVFDSQPRTISNLIVDQTSTNPAAVAAAAVPGAHPGQPRACAPCTTDPDPTATRRSTASRPAACRRTRRCSSRT